MTCECYRVAGWSSSVARRAHNPKVVGSNPAPATRKIKGFRFSSEAFFRKRDLFSATVPVPNPHVCQGSAPLQGCAEIPVRSLRKAPALRRCPTLFAGGALRQALLPQEDTGPDDRTVSPRTTALTKLPCRQKKEQPDDHPAWRAAPSLLPPSTPGRTGPRHVAG